MLADRVILKHNDVLIVTSLTGDIPARNDAGLGLYRSDSRFLSTYELRLDGRKPTLLNHGVDRGYVATFQLTNPTLEPSRGGMTVPAHSLSLRRTRFVHDGFHERIGLQNCNRHRVEVNLELRFDADFRDIFEVRSYRRQTVAGTVEPPEATPTGVRLRYHGSDEVERTTEIVLDPLPVIEHDRARVHVVLEPHETYVMLIDILPFMGDGDRPPLEDFSFDTALNSLTRTYHGWAGSCTRYQSDNEALDERLVWRNLEDLRMLCDDRPTGLFPTAGVPWYAVPFGRDSLVTSLQTLALNPDLALGSLRFLAQHQGRRDDAFREENPGKILHEIRFGELANLGLVPHTPYYGTVDATPLFLVLLVELLRWTGDAGLLTELGPNVEAALEWIDRYGDVDGDGFVEYAQNSREGVRNQGWKDSWDSLIDGTGEPAPLPAALVEVQGYVYQAKAGLAAILRRLGRCEEADRLAAEAEALRLRFEDRYWMPERGFYAQALNRDKRQVESITSNPGHCLWSGIASQDRADLVVARLMQPDMFSGWGVRTLATTAGSYNPMSYHNGSIWPHDNSIVAAGMRRYGHREAAERVARSVLEACLRFSDFRVPELFCGFARDRRFHAGPGEYLVSCSPQAWGAGALFHFLHVLLGVEADMLEGRLRIDPLPTSLYRRLRVEGMRVGDGHLDFTVECDGGVRVQVDRRPAGVKELELPT